MAARLPIPTELFLYMRGGIPMLQSHLNTSIKEYEGTATGTPRTIMRSASRLSSHRFSRSVLVTCFCLTSALTLGVGSVDAQIFPYHDFFPDGDVTDQTPGGHWRIEGGSPTGSMMIAAPGELVMKSAGSFFLVELIGIDGFPVDSRTDWSFRARVIFQPGGSFFGVGTKERNHAALDPDDGDGLRVGTSQSFTTVPIPYPYLGEEVLIQMDAFDGQIRGSVWKEGDPTSLVRASTSYTPVLTIPGFGINGHSTVHEIWIDTSPLPIVPHGDTDFDGDVDIDDLNNVRNDFGSVGRDDGSLAGDAFPWNGVVNIDDLNAVRNNFGAGVEPVPEPSTLALASLVALVVLAMRRRDGSESGTMESCRVGDRLRVR